MKKGQSTLEYVIILAAVIGAIIAACGAIQTGVQKTVDHIVNTFTTK